MDKEQEYQLMQNALSGDDGRSGTIFYEIRRRDEQIRLDEEKRKNEQALLLEHFAQLVGDVDSLLTDTETQLYETIQAYEKRLAQELQKASRTEDGRIVFKDKEGNIHAYDGEALTEEDIASIRWNPDACGQEYIKSITQTLDKLRAMNDRVFVMRNRFDDIKDDPTPENLNELEGLKDELTEISKNVHDFQLDVSKENHNTREFKVSNHSYEVPEIKSF